MSNARTVASATPRRVRSVHDLPIAARIVIAVLVTAITGSAAAWLALAELGAAADRTATIYHKNLVAGVGTVDSLSDTVRDVRLAFYVLLVVPEGAAKASQQTTVSDLDHQIDAKIEAYQPSAADPRALDAFAAAWADYRAARDTKVLPFALKQDLAGFNKARTDMGGAVQNMTKQLATLQAAERKQAQTAQEQSASAYRQARLLVIGLLLLGLIGAVAVAVVLARRMSLAARQVTGLAAALRAGDLSVRAHVPGGDELARMAADLDSAADTLQLTLGKVGASAENLATSADELSTVTSRVAGEAVRSSEQAAVVANGSSEVGANVQNLAGATEEMSASIREIASNASNAARTAEEAGAEVERIQETISKLGESSARISTVVNLISSIAEQTNLLALNATIEAARAGEAGKGFAVVAGEVKDLANQTARATTEISEQVETIQSDVNASVEAIGRIVGTVADINAIQTAIAGAVEQQTATTLDISRSVQEAAQGSTQISDTISEVADAATNTSAGVSQAQSATHSLAEMAGELRRLVATFRF